MSTAASGTPILDRLSPMPAPEKRSFAISIYQAMWFAAIGLITALYQSWHPPLLNASARWFGHAVQATSPDKWTAPALLLYAISFVVALFLSIGIHESAHALVGAAVGFRFNSLRVGPLQFDRPFRISLYRGRKTGARGWTSLFLVTHDKLIVRACAMLLAGPASNLVSAAVLAWLPVTGTFAAQFTYVSLCVGVMNLIPFRTRSVYSDGARVVMLLQNRARGERWLAMLKLMDEIRRGVDPPAMTQEFIAKAIALEDQSPDTISAHVLAFAAAFWTRNDAEAARTLEVCLRHASMAAPIMRQGLISNAVVFQARRRKRVDLAEQWQAELPPKTEQPWTRPWGEAAILEGKGDITGARATLDEIEALARKSPNEAVRDMVLRSLERWRDELCPASASDDLNERQNEGSSTGAILQQMG